MFSGFRKGTAVSWFGEGDGFDSHGRHHVCPTGGLSAVVCSGFCQWDLSGGTELPVAVELVRPLSVAGSTDAFSSQDRPLVTLTLSCRPAKAFSSLALVLLTHHWIATLANRAL